MQTSTQSRGRLVLVEDDAVMRGLLTVLLESDGWDVIQARDGWVGLRLTRHARPQVVVTDLGLPGLTGLELARRLAPSTVPVVGITADRSGLRDAAVDSGWFVDVLSKPVAPGPFLETVLQAVDGRS